MIDVTDRAAEKIKELLLADSRDLETWGLRLGVEGGGCSGFMYKMDFDARQDGDESVEKAGSYVYVDPKSAHFLEGMKLDWIDGITGAGFKIENPNAADSCGCGLSFSV